MELYPAFLITFREGLAIGIIPGVVVVILALSYLISGINEKFR